MNLATKTTLRMVTIIDKHLVHTPEPRLDAISHWFCMIIDLKSTVTMVVQRLSQLCNDPLVLVKSWPVFTAADAHSVRDSISIDKAVSP